MSDPIEAVVTYLQDVTAATVFGGELDRREAKTMPRQVVVVKPAGGGLLGASGQPFGDQRVDVDCYGETPRDSWLLHLAIEDALLSLSRRVYGSTLLHWAKPSARGTLARDPDTDWPISVSSYQVLAGRASTP